MRKETSAPATYPQPRRGGGVAKKHPALC